MVVTTLALTSAGCLETREAWQISSDGSGTYSLAVRWNADLLQRVEAIAGADAVRAVEGRSFPLRRSDWEDGLRDLEGVEVESLTETEAPGGFVEIALRARFRRLSDLFRWEVLARRTARVGPEGEGSARLAMDPLSHLPVIDALASLHALREADPERRFPAEQLASLPVSAEDAEHLATMLEPHLRQVRFAFRFETPGPILTVCDRARATESAVAPCETTFADIVQGRDRSLRLTWRPLSLDRVPVVEHVGDAAAPVLAK